MLNKTKVMYLISSNSHGMGGHYYSLRTTAEVLSNVIDPYIVTIGKTKSPVIELANIKYTHVYSNGWNNLMTIINLIKIVNSEKPKVIHGFDWGMPLYGRILSFLFKIPFINTLAGGGNPTAYYPYTKNLILFSQENFDFFKLNKKFEDSNLYLISNRITNIEEDYQRIKLLKEKLSDSRKTFLRIARFGTDYKESIIQAINLVVFLNQKDVKVQLVLIGTIENKNVYDEIRMYIQNKQEKNIYIFSDKFMTVNASELIDVADYVIGTGRGFMEACSRGKVMFTPIKGAELPALIDENNFLDFFKTNFSPRNQFPDKKIDENKNNIIALMNNINTISKAQLLSRKMFEKYFDLNEKKEEYKALYLDLQYDTKIHIFDFMELILRQLRSVTRS